MGHHWREAEEDCTEWLAPWAYDDDKDSYRASSWGWYPRYASFLLNRTYSVVLPVKYECSYSLAGSVSRWKQWTVASSFGRTGISAHPQPVVCRDVSRDLLPWLMFPVFAERGMRHSPLPLASSSAWYALLSKWLIFSWVCAPPLFPVHVTRRWNVHGV